MADVEVAPGIDDPLEIVGACQRCGSIFAAVVNVDTFDVKFVGPRVAPGLFQQPRCPHQNVCVSKLAEANGIMLKSLGEFPWTPGSPLRSRRA